MCIYPFYLDPNYGCYFFFFFHLKVVILTYNEIQFNVKERKILFSTASRKTHLEIVLFMHIVTFLFISMTVLIQISD